MLILGSCLALNLSYSGCCVFFLSTPCSNNGCYCDQYCHKWNDCCSDIYDIGCHPAASSSPIVLPTPTDILHVTSSKEPVRILINANNKVIKRLQVYMVRSYFYCCLCLNYNCILKILS